MNSPGTDAEMTIGDLAARFGLATHVLRHWEDMGLLAPARRVNGRRRYHRGHLTDIAVILLGKESGLTLTQLRALFHETDRSARRALLDGHWADLLRRIAAAQASLAVITHALDCDAEDFRRCPAFLRKVGAYLPPEAS